LIPIIILSIALYLFNVYSKNSVNNFVPKVLVIYKENTTNYLDIYNNFNQSYILNTQVTKVSDKEFDKTSISDYK
jgi:hypothetical protein